MIDPLLARFGRARLIGVVVACFGVACVMAVNEVAARAAEDALTSVRTRHEVRLDATRLQALMVDAETGVRGFLLTGREEYLEPKLAAKNEIAALLPKLTRTYDNTQWEDRVNLLRRQATEMLALMDEKQRLYREGRHDAWQALLMTNMAKDRMDAVRHAIGQVVEYQSHMLAEERRHIYTALNFGRYGVHVLVLLSLLWWLNYLRRSEEARLLLAGHADQLRLQRDHLEQQVLARTDELTDLARHLTRVREQEREHLARELHDELGALLTATKLDVARIRRMAAKASLTGFDERLTHISGLLDEGIALKRRIIEDLRPSSLSNLGLVPALDILAREFAERAGVRVHTELADVDCDDAGQLAIYRLVQEALTNVHKHARAQNVWVVMESDGANAMRLTIRDDGVGLQGEQQGFGHHGLLGMRYRMESLGGRLTVRSLPEGGVELRAQLPFGWRATDTLGMPLVEVPT